MQMQSVTADFALCSPAPGQEIPDPLALQPGEETEARRKD